MDGEYHWLVVRLVVRCSSHLIIQDIFSELRYQGPSKIYHLRI